VGIASAGAYSIGCLALGHTSSSAGPGTPYGRSPWESSATANGACLSNTVSKRMPVRGPFVPASGEPLSLRRMSQVRSYLSARQGSRGGRKNAFQGEEEPPVSTRFCVSDPVTVGSSIAPWYSCNSGGEEHCQMTRPYDSGSDLDNPGRNRIHSIAFFRRSWNSRDKNGDKYATFLGCVVEWQLG
jgi:hypothetical protein